MTLVVRGDTRAFAILYDRHAVAAYSLAYRICGRRPSAEEVVQEAFLAAWRRRSSFDPTRGGVRPWILTLVRNRSIDALRHASATTVRDVHDERIAAAMPALELTDIAVERRSETVAIRAALEQLPDEQQRVIELAFFGGFTHLEIAAMLNVPAGTVKGRMRLGLMKLRTALSEQVSVMV